MLRIPDYTIELATANENRRTAAYISNCIKYTCEHKEQDRKVMKLMMSDKYQVIQVVGVY